MILTAWVALDTVINVNSIPSASVESISGAELSVAAVTAGNRRRHQSVLFGQQVLPIWWGPGALVTADAIESGARTNKTHCC